MSKGQPHPQPQRSPKTSNQLPKNWPREISYLTSIHIPQPLSSSLLHIQVNPPTGSNAGDRFDSISSLPIIESRATVSPNPLVRITPITSASHPANGQYGLFAARALPPSTFIILYLGTLHRSCNSPAAEEANASSSSATSSSITGSTADSSYATSDYDLSLDRDLGLAIDASKCGNEARFINDYRGIRPAGPNAEFRDCLVQVGPAPGRLERRIGVFVLSPGKAGGARAKGIAKGEEIVVSYGKGFWNARKDG
ncbi:hypothetical protein A1O1_02285 [Capronia coronata CBS 617.96]|uniref:SET domain-containing protein n=1 Tax=Capronia coronata CBS 617.96 TaxID=1182541 RepID=W9YLY6_9EURO|nr:uncharacterized protein A1O1_02285 [Capronia coronata CBS 617.96]EXJ93892.1 hypothetical protein A1O1_02285 [Capronia coronata CBS 617.96]